MNFEGRALLSSICAVGVLSGCATWSTSSVDTSDADSRSASPSSSTPPKSTAEVLITDTDILDRRYASLGDVNVTVNKSTIFHPNPTREMVNEKLREKAAAMGADAVILVRYGTVGMTFFSYGSLDGKGRAIKFLQ